MALFTFTLAAIAATYFYLQERTKKKVAYIVHVQGQTEQAETLDFAVHLFEDESDDKWQEKLYKAFEIQEKRRAFNNDRLMRDNQKRFEEIEALRKDKA